MILNSAQQKLAEKLTNRFHLSSFLFKKVPLAWLVGVRIEKFDPQNCITSVPFKWLTKNPFKSMYFAAQSMAAEFSTAIPCLIAVQGHTPSVALIAVDLKAVFSKKATDRVYFTCEDNQKAFEAVEKCTQSKEVQAVTLKTVGKMKNGTVVSEFELTWSFRQRSS